MALQRSATRATNAELREDLDDVIAQIPSVSSENYQTFFMPGVVTLGQQLTFRVYGNKDLINARASLRVEQSSGSAVSVNIDNDGTSALGSEITIDNGEKTSRTSTQPTIIAPSFVDDAEVNAIVTAIGDGTAEDLSITFAWGAYTATPPSGFDADAQAFFTAAGITDGTQKDAINALVVGLKADSIWSKMLAIYPFVGGTATKHSFNLKNTATYQITFHGGITHSSTGCAWNGSTGYADTGIVPATHMTDNDTHCSYYSRTANTVDGADMGAFATASYYGIGINCYYTFAGDRAFSYAYNTSSDWAVLTSAENTSSLGFYVGSRTSSTSHTMYKNGVAGTVATASSSGFSSINTNIYIGAQSHTGGFVGYGDRECAFASVGSGLTSTDASNLYSRVQTYQTALGRQV